MTPFKLADLGRTIAFLMLFLLPLVTSPAAQAASKAAPPAPLREFRGAWVATVGNIDWPSRKTLTAKEQKEELLAILDKAVRLKLNAVIFQVRPACDAMYASRLEPWSEYLTGTMGKAPEPFYDPLTFVIEEAHKRGLELHAWFNPYRARLHASDPGVAATHVSKTHPQLVRRYGDMLWLDPGEKEVQEYSLSVVMDVVKRYDVDGIHFDDYFYPYKVKGASGQDLEFPDDASWHRFGAGGKLSRDDWRRENVNLFMQHVYSSIKAAKPFVKFGVSPFGIWRPHNPQQIEGFDSYDKLYADSKKWLAHGWLDYFAPQLYWAIDPPAQSFPALLNWWSQQNPKHRTLCPGLNTTKAGGRSPSRRGSWQPEEIVRQISLTRTVPGGHGHIHWNMRSLMRNEGLDEALLKDSYQQPALMPLTPWLGKATPSKPKLSSSPNGITWSANGSSQAWLWLLQTRRDGTWHSELLPGAVSSHGWGGAKPESVALCAVNRNAEVSAPATLQIRP